MGKQFEQRFHTGDVEVREDGGVTRIEGYAAVFNRYSEDLGGFVERIAPGAFTRTINDPHTEVQAWFNHNPDNLLASRTNGSLVLEQDDRGLRYSIQIDESDPDHQRVLAKIRRGDLRGSSFGFRVEEDSWGVTEEDYPLRTIERVSVVRDVGPVSVPAYPDTATMGAVALRSLAGLTEVPVEKLVEAGSRNELREFLLKLHGGPVSESSGYLVGESSKEIVLPPGNFTIVGNKIAETSSPTVSNIHKDINRALKVLDDAVVQLAKAQDDDGAASADPGAASPDQRIKQRMRRLDLIIEDNKAAQLKLEE